MQAQSVGKPAFGGMAVRNPPVSRLYFFLKKKGGATVDQIVRAGVAHKEAPRRYYKRFPNVFCRESFGNVFIYKLVDGAECPLSRSASTNNRRQSLLAYCEQKAHYGVSPHSVCRRFGVPEFVAHDDIASLVALGVLQRRAYGNYVYLRGLA